MKKFLVKVNGNPYEVEVDEIKQSKTAAESGHTPITAPKPAPVAPKVPVQDKKLETAAAAQPVISNAAAGSKVVKAPMPGTVLRVDVNAGDAIAKGAVLLILEAMKMENEIVSPFEGTVVSVNVAKGSAVTAGQVLVTVE